MTTSVSGLVSGLDTTSIIQQLIALESRPIQTLQDRVKLRTSEQTEIKALMALIMSPGPGDDLAFGLVLGAAI